MAEKVRTARVFEGAALFIGDGPRKAAFVVVRPFSEGDADLLEVVKAGRAMIGLSPKSRDKDGDRHDKSGSNDQNLDQSQSCTLARAAAGKSQFNTEKKISRGYADVYLIDNQECY